MQKRNQLKEQLNLLEKVTVSVRSKISVVLFIAVCVIDHSSRWVADLINPRVPGVRLGSPEYRVIEEGYFHILFLFDSLKMCIVSVLAYLFIKTTFKSNRFIVWLSFSWMTLNTSDLVDNLTGFQNEFTFWDWLSIGAVLYSMLTNVIISPSNQFSEPFRLIFSKLK
ncbi:hypothetical protein N9924_00110 [bacterium]|nr:hypothetical protein [bacterium]